MTVPRSRAGCAGDATVDFLASGQPEFQHPSVPQLPPFLADAWTALRAVDMVSDLAWLLVALILLAVLLRILGLV